MGYVSMQKRRLRLRIQVLNGVDVPSPVVGLISLRHLLGFGLLVQNLQHKPQSCSFQTVINIYKPVTHVNSYIEIKTKAMGAQWVSGLRCCTITRGVQEILSSLPLSILS